MFRLKRFVKLPGYVKKKIWLKSYPEDLPAKVEIPKKSLSQVFQEAAIEHGTEVSVVFYGKETRREEIFEWSLRLATVLHNMGIGKGDVVAIYLPNSVQFIVAYQAILRSGATVTTINPLFVPREIAYQLQDSGAETIITIDLFYNNVKQIKNETPLKNIIVCNLKGEKLQVDKEDLANISNYDELINETPPTPPIIQINPKKDVAVIQYTGGTTGLPKGVMLTHYNILASAYQAGALATANLKSMKEEKYNSISILPWYHIYGQAVELVFGACRLVPREPTHAFTQFDAVQILDAIQKYRPNTMTAVPTILAMLLYHPRAHDTDFTCLKSLTLGSSACPIELMKKWEEVSGNPINEGYGLTEASSGCLSRQARLHGNVPGSVGPPQPNTLAGIVNPETNDFLPIGQLGELVISGPQVMKGYWNRPEEDKKVFFKAGGKTWLKSGDLARMDEKGYFYIVDRVKDIIKYKGHSVYPREIEEALFEHEAVMDVAVIGVPDLVVGEQIKAFVVLKPQFKGKTKEYEILDWCKDRMGGDKYPRNIEFRDSLPKSLVGKTLRRVLREEEARKAQKA